MEYVILFGFMRGSAGDVIQVSEADAPSLLDAGLIAAHTTPAEEVADAADTGRPGRKRGNTQDR